MERPLSPVKPNPFVPMLKVSRSVVECEHYHVDKQCSDNVVVGLFGTLCETHFAKIIIPLRMEFDAGTLRYNGIADLVRKVRGFTEKG